MTWESTGDEWKGCNRERGIERIAAAAGVPFEEVELRVERLEAAAARVAESHRRLAVAAEQVSSGFRRMADALGRTRVVEPSGIIPVSEAPQSGLIP